LSEMYSLSESSIRRIIIRQRKRYEEMKETVNKVIKSWNVGRSEIKQIYDTVWQVGDDYILKVYEDVNMLERNIKIITILDDMDIPVGSIITTKDNKTYVSDDMHYFILSEKLPGSNIVSMKDNMDVAYKMGEIIAALHMAFKECESQDEFWDNSLLSEMKGWIGEALCNSSWRYVSKEKYDETVSGLKSLYDKLPVQLIHRDVHFGNFLFDKGEFSGYIDFDLSQRNIRIFDLCYFLLGLLSEEEKLEVTGEEWFEILENLFKGYEKTIALSTEEKQAVVYVMKSIELLFVAWFSGQEDKKCAEDAMKIYDFVDNNQAEISRRLFN
ncbi:MAG: phosphotransferase, partial [Lachnospiraceae bacterium]|nr:phosphotransferase [Lachnospiraceae bacterium]